MTTTRKRAPYGAVKEACSLADGMGVTARDVAKATGFPVHSIRACARDYGFALLPERRPHGSVKAIVKAGIRSRMTLSQIIHTSGIPAHTIYSAARRLGFGACKPRQGSLRS